MPWKYLSLCLIAAVAAQDAQYKWTVGGKHILLWCTTNGMDYDKVTTKETHVTASGEPARLQYLEMGLTAVGQTMEYRWVQIDSKTIEVRYARLEHGAKITIDTDAGYQAQVADAKAQNLPIPPAPLESSVSKIESELFLYTGDVKTGKLVTPQPWTFTQSSKGITEHEKDGRKTRVNYDQIIDADGAKGTMNVGLDKAGTLDQPTTGSLDGPVHFKIIRHEIEAGSNVVTTSTYTAVADHIDINLTTTPGTVTALGNVTVHAVTDGIESEMHADTFVLRVSDTYEPLGYTSSSPNSKSKMTIKQTAGGSQ